MNISPSFRFLDKPDRRTKILERDFDTDTVTVESTRFETVTHIVGSDDSEILSYLVIEPDGTEQPIWKSKESVEPVDIAIGVRAKTDQSVSEGVVTKSNLVT